MQVAAGEAPCWKFPLIVWRSPIHTLMHTHTRISQTWPVWGEMGTHQIPAQNAHWRLIRTIEHFDFRTIDVLWFSNVVDSPETSNALLCIQQQQHQCFCKLNQSCLICPIHRPSDSRRYPLSWFKPSNHWFGELQCQNCLSIQQDWTRCDRIQNLLQMGPR